MDKNKEEKNKIKEPNNVKKNIKKKAPSEHNDPNKKKKKDKEYKL